VSSERAAEPTRKRLVTEALIYLVVFLLFGGALAWVQAERKPERAGIRAIAPRTR
jgi:hypothetical protein